MPFEPTFQAFLEELEGLIASTWPEITMPGTSDGHGAYLPPQFFTSIEAYRANIIKRATDGMQGKPHTAAPPFVVLHIGEATEDENWGPDNRPLRYPVSFIYLTARKSGAVQATPHAKVLALKDVIDAPGAIFNTFMGVENGNPNSSETDPTNAALIAGSNEDLIAASLSYTPGLLTGYFNNS